MHERKDLGAGSLKVVNSQGLSKRNGAARGKGTRASEQTGARVTRVCASGEMDMEDWKQEDQECAGKRHRNEFMHLVQNYMALGVFSSKSDSHIWDIQSVELDTHLVKNPPLERFSLMWYPQGRTQWLYLLPVPAVASFQPPGTSFWNTCPGSYFLEAALILDNAALP